MLKTKQKQCVTENTLAMLKIVTRALNAVLPSRCPLTGEIVESPGLLSAQAIQALDFIEKPFCKSCGVPFRFVYAQDDIHHDMECASCAARKPSFDRARAALVYDQESRKIILAFKHGDHIHMTSSLVPLLRKACEEMAAECDVILPVPLHWLRMVKRRYNQAALLATGLGHDVQKPVLLEALERTRYTTTQGHKNVKDRKANVRGAFRVSKKFIKDLKGKKVLLVDDVLTTGATVEACATALYAIGVARVDVVTLARTVKASDNV